MKIILREDVRDLGRSGQLVEVKEGYARNYLLPKKLAVVATDGNLRDFNKRISAAREREERERAAANAIADRIRGKRYLLIHKAVEGGTRIHGSITTAEVAQVVQAADGVELDRRDIDIRQPIRSLGEYQVNVKLMRGLTVPIRLLVAESEPVEEEAAPAVEETTEEPAAEAAAE